MTNTMQSVANNTEKYLTYKEQMTRLNKARTFKVPNTIRKRFSVQ